MTGADQLQWSARSFIFPLSPTVGLSEYLLCRQQDNDSLLPLCYDSPLKRSRPVNRLRLFYHKCKEYVSRRAPVSLLLSGHFSCVQVVRSSFFLLQK